MEKIKKIVHELRTRSRSVTEDQILHVVREYLQVLALKIIYQSEHGRCLSFMGGTCLRLCYDLKRYSEDLDFCLDRPSGRYRFSSMVRKIQRELETRGFEVVTNVHEEKTVQKAFLRFSGFQEGLNLTGFRKNQKLHIKLEVDRKPPPLQKDECESFFVHRFNEIFPILKHNRATLFAGKVLAVLQRPYTRGRDYYDLIWYLTHQVPLNLSYFRRGFQGDPPSSLEEVFKALETKVLALKPEVILRDMGAFLEDPQEADWIRRYQELFSQCLRSYV